MQSELRDKILTTTMENLTALYLTGLNSETDDISVWHLKAVGWREFKMIFSAFTFYTIS